MTASHSTHDVTKEKPVSVAFHDLQINTTARTVTRGAQAIELRRKEFDILECLMCNAGTTVTRSKMLEQIWGSQTPWTNVVDVHIKHLRDKVDRPFETAYIQTIHGVGYRLEAKPSRIPS